MMDGVAIDSSSYLDGQRSFTVSAVAAAGEPQAILPNSKSCVEIMTGAALPQGADCVIRIEDLALNNHVATIFDNLEITSGLAVHREGTDCRTRQPLLSPGTTLTAKELAVIASIGKTQLTVSSIPKIAIVATGNELVEVSQIPERHQIRRSNDTALAAALSSSGHGNVEAHHLPDDKDIVQTRISSILDSCDVLIVAGGVSKGKFDYLPEALESNKANKIFQWVSQRPGKPFWFGNCPKEDRSIPIFALPGNPVSCFSCLHRFAIPALDTIAGRTPRKPQFAQLAADFTFKPPLTHYLPVNIECSPGGQLIATPAPSNTSGDFASVAHTDGFLELPKNSPYFPTGTACRYFPWQT